MSEVLVIGVWLSTKIEGFCALCGKSVKFGILFLLVPNIVTGPPGLNHFYKVFIKYLHVHVYNYFCKDRNFCCTSKG